jgi:hypothetical protein
VEALMEIQLKKSTLLDFPINPKVKTPAHSIIENSLFPIYIPFYDQNA